MFYNNSLTEVNVTSENKEKRTMSFCELILVGNVGREPELRFTSSGSAVCNFSLAVNRTWTDRNSSEKREATTWFKVTVWGPQAETINQFVQKGKQVLVVADRIEADAYVGQDGSARATLNVTARTVRFLNGGAGGNMDYGNEQDDGYMPPNVDDIPF
jgi:single-strand DNA-binding protein